uniref:Putative secreted protein n=1 Tax=Anopheles triannulatus TaxID=58253 RepID=A0A2M4B0Z9_9DIPT
MLPVDALVVVLLLLQLEDVLHEELLQVFVRKVNAKLLEAVVVKVLEAKDVQHTDRAACRRFRFVDRLIDLLHDQHEQPPVDALHERIPHVHRLIARERRHDRFAVREQRFARQRIDERLQGHLEQIRHPLDVDVLRDFRRIEIVDHGRVVLDVARVQQGGEKLQYFPDFMIRKAKHLHRRPNVGKLGRIVTAIAPNAATAGQVAIVGRLAQVEPTFLFRRKARQQAVEDVIVAFVRVLRHDAGLFQQVLLNLGTLDDATTVEVDVDVLAEAGRVVVAHRFRITERFQDRVRLEDLLLNPRVLATDRCQVLEDELRAFRLTGTGFAGDDDALVLPVASHVRVRVVTDGEDVRR